MLTGGGALLRRLDQRLREETGVPVRWPKTRSPRWCKGAGRMLDDVALLRRVAWAA